ncbi:Uncharacterised protein [uncultured Clostridium sp.]|nr:Uncharacterised protein [uncultured Clostridium sp.]
MKAIIFHNELIQIGLRPFWKENTWSKRRNKAKSAYIFRIRKPHCRNW